MESKERDMNTNGKDLPEKMDCTIPDNDKSFEKCEIEANTVSTVSFKMPTLPSFAKPKRSEEKDVGTTNCLREKENSTSKSSTIREAKEKILTDENPSTSVIKNCSKAVSKLSPAEQLQQSRIAIPYKEPPWGGICEDEYKCEVLKNGTIVDSIKLDKSYIVFGRLPSCDVPMEHPSLSRHHAVLQFCTTTSEEREKGWYLYDLDSTHGTWINKNKVYPKKYYRIRVGHVLKFGGSTRLHILQVRTTTANHLAQRF